MSRRDKERKSEIERRMHRKIFWKKEEEDEGERVWVYQRERVRAYVCVRERDGENREWRRQSYICFFECMGHGCVNSSIWRNVYFRLSINLCFLPDLSTSFPTQHSIHSSSLVSAFPLLWVTESFSSHLAHKKYPPQTGREKRAEVLNKDSAWRSCASLPPTQPPHRRGKEWGWVEVGGCELSSLQRCLSSTVTSV